MDLKVMNKARKEEFIFFSKEKRSCIERQF